MRERETNTLISRRKNNKEKRITAAYLLKCLAVEVVDDEVVLSISPFKKGAY